MRCVYKVKGSRWKQEPLLYGEWLACMRLLKGRMAKVRDAGISGVAEVLQEMSEDGTLTKLMAVVLKPYGPTPLHRWLNARAAKRHDLSPENLVMNMEAREVARAGIDFFRINLRLTRSLLAMPVTSGWPWRKKLSLSEILVAFLKVYGTYQRAITTPGSELAPSQQ